MFLFTNLIMATDPFRRYRSIREWLQCTSHDLLQRHSCPTIPTRMSGLRPTRHMHCRQVARQVSLRRRLQVPHMTIRPTPQPAWSLWHFYNTPSDYYGLGRTSFGVRQCLAFVASLQFSVRDSSLLTMSRNACSWTMLRFSSLCDHTQQLHDFLEHHHVLMQTVTWWCGRCGEVSIAMLGGVHIRGVAPRLRFRGNG